MAKSEVVEEIARQGFKADEGQFERQFKKWNFRKNLTRKEWQYVSRIVEKRKREGKESDLKVDGILTPRKKVQKAISRYGQGSTLEMIQHTLREGQRERSLTPNGLVVYTPPASVCPKFSTDLIPWLNFYTTIKSHLQSKGWLFNENGRIINHQGSSMWSNTIRAALPVSQLELGDSTRSGICHDVVQGSGFNKFAFSVLLASNRMRHVLANAISTPDLSKQNLGKIILQHLQSRINFPVFEFLIARHDETIQALSEIMFKEALLEMNVGLVDLLLRCFKVDPDALLPGPWEFPPGHPLVKANGNTVALLPLELAIETKHAPMVRTLVRRGADIFATGLDRGTMVSLALQSTTEILHILLDNWLGLDPQCAILRAVSLGLFDDVEMFLAHGADPNTSDDRFGGPALAVSIETANFHIAHLLLDAAAEVKVHNWIGKSPLRLAIEHQNLDFVRRLLDLGALLEADDSRCSTLTHIVQCAVDKDDFDLTHILLEYGADANAGREPFYDHLLPFESAATRGNIRLAELLLTYGAYRDSDSLSWEMLSMSSDGIQLFLDHEVLLNSDALILAAGAGDLAMVKRLLSAGADINACHRPVFRDESYPQYHTAVTLAVSEIRYPFEMVSFLIDSGADINHPMASPTALELATRERNAEIIDFLLERGANCGHPDVLEAAVTKTDLQMLKNLMSEINNQGILHRPCHPCLYHPALAAAAASGNLEKVEVILEQCVGIVTPSSANFPDSKLRFSRRSGRHGP